LDAVAALAAGEIGRRSSRDLGYSGLAQSQGFRSPEEFLQSVSGLTRTEATKLVKVGAVLVDPSPSSPLASVWHSAIGAAVSAGDISADAAQAILRGLGSPDATVTPLQLSAAADQLLADARTLNADVLFRHARQLRDLLDADGIATREAQRQDLRYFRAGRRPDGMVSGSFLLDEEDGTLLLSALDSALSPRRGGPRFTDPDARAAAEALVVDPRTNDQLAADVFAAMLRLAVDADPSTLFGRHRPAVRVLITDHNLRSRGHGSIEGAPDPIAFGTVERHLCDTGALEVTLDADGIPYDHGREKRLFTERQRIALAIRDGGCLFPECSRPPSHCEAHHINQWHRDRGRTDLADGVLLCRFHHMLLHNNDWQITRAGTEYSLVPPPGVDAERRPIALRGKGVATPSVALHRESATSASVATDNLRSCVAAQ
jgi:hypothetical protein